MKVLLLAASISLLLACNKSANLDPAANLRFENSAIKQVVLEKNTPLQKVMYNALTASKKFTLWDQKFDFIL